MTTETRAVHGTNSRYVLGCSCLSCCDAHATYQREYRARRKVWDIEYQGRRVGQMVEVEVRG